MRVCAAFSHVSGSVWVSVPSRVEARRGRGRSDEKRVISKVAMASSIRGSGFCYASSEQDDAEPRLHSVRTKHCHIQSPSCASAICARSLPSSSSTDRLAPQFAGNCGLNISSGIGNYCSCDKKKEGLLVRLLHSRGAPVVGHPSLLPAHTWPARATWGARCQHVL